MTSTDRAVRCPDRPPICEPKLLRPVREAPRISRPCFSARCSRGMSGRAAMSAGGPLGGGEDDPFARCCATSTPS